MSEGKIEQIGTPMALYENPASRFVAEFIGAPPMNVVQIDTPFGHAMAAIAGGAPDGADAVGVRPEMLRIARDGPEAEVILVEALGAETPVHLRIGAARLILRDGHGNRMKASQTMRIETNTEAVRFFDKTGKALRRAYRLALMQAVSSQEDGSQQKTLTAQAVDPEKPCIRRVQSKVTHKKGPQVIWAARAKMATNRQHVAIFGRWIKNDMS
jgi:hypothetical protein